MSAKILDLAAYRLRRLAPRVIDIPTLRRAMTPAMRRVARRIEDLVRARGVPFGAAAWAAWSLHPRLQGWQIQAALDYAKWCMQRRA